MRRIVIADDSMTARMFIRRCLEIIGFTDSTIIESENGREALARIKEEPTDLLITDLNMPVMDGEVLLRWVKANPRLSDLPVLVITSAGNPAREAQLLSMGAIGVINKPVSPALLQRKLQSWMSQGDG